VVVGKRRGQGGAALGEALVGERGGGSRGGPGPVLHVGGGIGQHRVREPQRGIEVAGQRDGAAAPRRGGRQQGLLHLVQSQDGCRGEQQGAHEGRDLTVGVELAGRPGGLDRGDEPGPGQPGERGQVVGLRRGPGRRGLQDEPDVVGDDVHEVAPPLHDGGRQRWRRWQEPVGWSVQQEGDHVDKQR